MLRNAALQTLTIAVGVTIGVLVLANPNLIEMHGTGLNIIAVAAALLAYDLTAMLADRFEEDIDNTTEIANEIG